MVGRVLPYIGAMRIASSFFWMEECCLLLVNGGVLPTIGGWKSTAIYWLYGKLLFATFGHNLFITIDTKRVGIRASLILKYQGQYMNAIKLGRPIVSYGDHG